MHHRTRQALLSLPIILLVGTFIAWAGSDGSTEVGGWPLFALCAGVAFGLNWLVFIPAYVFQTERYYDLTGSLTYLSLIGTALWLGPRTPRGFLLSALVAVWAIRLGLFLFRRIRADGSDGRFDRIKPDFARFLMTWTLQGLWVFLTLSCALVALTSSSEGAPTEIKGLDLLAVTGSILWIAGFGIEVVADLQKRRFRENPENSGAFITSGLWAWSRHPNYFGEIMLWCGVALIAIPALSGWQWTTLISPLFVFVLLTRISGVPLLEARGQQSWGDDPAYQAYLARTPTLVPRPPR
jgi:steroid 5-alpha reductase family enzyme